MEDAAWQQKCMVAIALRFFLICIYLVCEILPPFNRVIQPEEVWLYKYPSTPSYIPMLFLWVLALSIPIAVLVWNYRISCNRVDLTEGLWCFSLIISLNGAITNTLKLLVGRPRPDYAQRCFPDTDFMLNEQCTGSYYSVQDGRKSFPSGHSSVAFASFGFLSLYLAGKFRLFTPAGKGCSVKLVTAMLPLYFATCVAVSRTCDYHHHWQDVTVGSILGLFVGGLCYFQFFPSLTSEKCDMPWLQIGEAGGEDSAALRVKHI